MIDKLKLQILEFCKAMEEDKLVELGDTMSVRTENGMLITSPLKPMAQITEEDIIILQKRMLKMSFRLSI